MSRSVFSKVATTDGETYFLLTKLKDEGKEGIALVLSNGKCSWTGDISEEDLDKLCVKIKMDFNSYVTQTVHALTGEKRKTMTFQYQTKTRKTAGSIDFIWKKHVATENITFQLGTVLLKEVDDPSSVTCDLLSHCIDSMGHLKTKIHSLETDNERLTEERASAMKRLEKCVVAKEELETELYSKFVEILNSKKDKIRRLKDDLESRSTLESNKGTEAKRNPDTVGEKMEVSEKNATSDEDADTGDESPTPSARQRTKRRKLTKTTAEDSLILDDDIGDKQVVARPKRRQPGNKKQTPSKPSLPRVSSKTSLGSSGSSDGRRTSMRQSISSTSNKSNENIDAEDLIDNML